MAGAALAGSCSTGPAEPPPTSCNLSLLPLQDHEQPRQRLRDALCRGGGARQPSQVCGQLHRLPGAVGLGRVRALGAVGGWVEGWVDGCTTASVGHSGYEAAPSGSQSGSCLLGTALPSGLQHSCPALPPNCLSPRPPPDPRRRRPGWTWTGSTPGQPTAAAPPPTRPTWPPLPATSRRRWRCRARATFSPWPSAPAPTAGQVRALRLRRQRGRVCVERGTGAPWSGVGGVQPLIRWRPPARPSCLPINLISRPQAWTWRCCRSTSTGRFAQHWAVPSKHATPIPSC